MQSFSLCSYCAHFSTDDPEFPTCEAFPNGIPTEILEGGFDHRVPFEDEEELLFKKRPGVKMPSDEQLVQLLATKRE